MTHISHSDSSSGVQTAQEIDAEDPDADPRPLIVDVVLDDADWSAFNDVEAVVAVAADAVGARQDLKIGRAEATVALSSDAEVATLNGTYRGKPKPTNVLSFPAGPASAGAPEAARRFLGDIIVARETVMVEAADQGIPPVHHLQHLVVHGLLHLMGYDHENDEDANIMETLETSILAGIGIPDPYLVA
jgi:probable rRNA maturation factor